MLPSAALPQLRSHHDALESPPAPSVSVIIPVKDTETALLRRAIESVLDQDHRGPLEIVVWDDGSRVRRYREHCALITNLQRDTRHRLQHRRSAHNQGISAARNHGWRLATGQWLAWLDSDDALPRDALARLWTATTRSPNALLVIGQCEVHLPDGTVREHRNNVFIRAWQDVKGRVTDPLLTTVFAVHGTLVHRDLVDRVGGFDEGLSHGELTDWFLRSLAAVSRRRVMLLDSVTYHHYKRDGSHSTDRATLEQHRWLALARYAKNVGLPAGLVLRGGVRCPDTGARRYALVDVDGSVLVRAEADPADVTRTDVLPRIRTLSVIPAEASSALPSSCRAAHPVPAVRHRAGTA